MVTLLGYIAVILGLEAQISKKRTNLLLLKGTGNVFYTLHFFLLDAVSGAYISGIYALTDFISIPNISKKKQAFIRSALVATAFFILFDDMKKNPVEIFPFLAFIGNIIATYMRSNLNMRYCILGFGIPCWFTYGICVNSIPSLVAQVVLLFSGIIGIRKVKKEMKENQATTIDTKPSAVA
jgi:uncharacterized protein with PQ loop repeat